MPLSFQSSYLNDETDRPLPFHEESAENPWSADRFDPHVMAVFVNPFAEEDITPDP
jgi:hypothetical protein